MGEKKGKEITADEQTGNSYNDILGKELKGEIKEFVSKVENQARWPTLKSFVQEAVRDKLAKERQR